MNNKNTNKHPFLSNINKIWRFRFLNFAYGDNRTQFQNPFKKDEPSFSLDLPAFKSLLKYLEHHLVVVS